MTSSFSRRAVAAALLSTGLALGAVSPALATPTSATASVDTAVRFATFNASLNRGAEGELVRDLSTGTNAQAAAVAEIIQRSAPDVLLINEFDYVAGGQAAELFRDNYLAVSHHGSTPVDYPYYYVAPVNTGVPSGKDLDNNGSVGGPGDAYGFGLFPGQYGMVVYSKYPIATEQIRTFQNFLWKDMPGALLPDDPATPIPADYYSPDELDVFRLSSKSHWDLPIRIGTGASATTVHFLVSHPTPPVFDGPEKRNATRNHDEIRLWADYISGGTTASYLYDDNGVRGGLAPGERFVIAGDQNADPYDGDSMDNAIHQLLDHPRINTSVTPESQGGVAAAAQGGSNDSHVGPDAQDTADFNDAPGTSGNLRADYVLPSRQLPILDAGIFWPTPDEEFSYLTDPTGNGWPAISSDHRLVWVDVHLNNKN
ncbi:Endonuclease/Exonuclease/phosphatase family protein [Raineyella antarctica]|uniref:Endonuclease/Exonuclease/phosphatase family protein n=1 Tax=Raineyella antarctica TaxID=1577474 RepID=A0A1G6IFC5_9ACTN|nr:endonuclease/exonuclease/phosphatase family protein [Raineyella antarctica]SDC05100.1 Endonuclease/Exonuclease/phosphatase family protein [Raineyella antarctica]